MPERFALRPLVILFVLGVLLITAPDTIPALTIPGSGSMPPMNQMSP